MTPIAMLGLLVQLGVCSLTPDMPQQDGTTLRVVVCPLVKNQAPAQPDLDENREELAPVDPPARGMRKAPVGR